MILNLEKSKLCIQMIMGFEGCQSRLHLPAPVQLKSTGN